MSNVSNEGKTLQDQGARDVIAQDLDSNVMVLAGAGAGKTTALVQRMIAVVRTGACEIDRMAAITFTRKAAGEMRGRFFLGLREEAKKDLGLEERKRIEVALDRIDQCFMGTIHSFCGRLIRTRPIEAKLAPGFREIEGHEEARLQREHWSRFLQRQYANKDIRLEKMRDRGIVPEDLYPFFKFRCGYSDLPLKETVTPKPDLVSCVDDVRVFLDQIVPCMPIRPEHLDKLMMAVRRARHFMENHEVTNDGDAAQLLAFFETIGRGSTRAVTLKYWNDPGEAKTIRDELLPDLQEQIVIPVLRQWREFLYRYVASFVDDAVAYSDGARHEEGRLTFQDLLLRAAALLRDNASVRAHLQGKYRTLFVDEFQDTDPIQAEIVAYLTGTDLEERYWRKLVPRPGGLFLVGDDKQSIYRFRRADVEIFRFVAERIEQTGGKVVHLNTSFRSLGNLCHWINSAFSPILSKESAPYQAPFQPLYRHRPDGPDVHCVRTISIPEQESPLRENSARIDARRIASFIVQAMRGETTFNQSKGEKKALLGEKASAGDFLILTRTNDQLPVYTRALENAGVPYDVVGGGRLGDSEEVRAVVTMLEAVHVPDNPVPFVAFLRGPLAGLSDDALYAYRIAGGRFDWSAPTPEALPSAIGQRFDDAKTLLVQAEKDFATFPPPAALERILGRCGYLALAPLHPDGGAASRAGNLIRLLALAQRFAAQGYPWGRIVEEFRELVQDPEYKVEQMSVDSGREDVVRLMNVHQAKGLEARVVFLADPADGSVARQIKKPKSHVSRSGEVSYLSAPVMKPFGKYQQKIVAQPAGWEEDQEEAKRFQLAEEARLLYVAATRARNLLVVSVYTGRKMREEGPWKALNPYLANVPELEEGGHWEDNVAWPRDPVNIHEVEADGGNGQDDAGERSVAHISEPEGSTSDASHRTLSFSPGYEELCTQAAERLRRAQEASYSLRSVTRARTEEEWVSKSPVPAGRGMKYGQLVHRLFEEAVRDGLPGDPSLRVAQLADQINLDRDDAGGDTGALLSGADSMGEDVETFAVQHSEASKEVRSQADLTAEDVKAAVRAVERLKKSPLWETLQCAHEVYTEAPLAATEGDAEHATVTRGVIDLAYRDEAGWHIVDYKTDRADTEEASAAIEKKYRSQLDAYATYWSRLTGTPVADAKLWLAHGPTG